MSTGGGGNDAAAHMVQEVIEQNNKLMTTINDLLGQIKIANTTDPKVKTVSDKAKKELLDLTRDSTTYAAGDSTRRPKLNLEQFSGKPGTLSAAEFVSKAHNLKAVGDYSDEEFLMLVRQSLQGGAYTYMNSLGEEVKNDPELLCAAILQRYKIKPSLEKEMLLDNLEYKGEIDIDLFLEKFEEYSQDVGLSNESLILKWSSCFPTTVKNALLLSKISDFQELVDHTRLLLCIHSDCFKSTDKAKSPSTSVIASIEDQGDLKSDIADCKNMLCSLQGQNQGSFRPYRQRSNYNRYNSRGNYRGRYTSNYRGSSYRSRQQRNFNQQSGKRCFTCSGLGHFSHLCPSKGNLGSNSSFRTTSRGRQSFPRGRQRFGQVSMLEQQNETDYNTTLGFDSENNATVSYANQSDSLPQDYFGVMEDDTALNM